MKLEVSNRREVITLAAIFAGLGFVMAFLSAPFILDAVYGIKPLDPGYMHYTGEGGIEYTPYQDFIFNGCLTKPFTYVEDETVVLDTNGLVELGMIWFDPNTCFDIAMTMSDTYTIDSVVKDVNDQMIITLKKK